jgi:hypothetical protein
MKYGDVGHLITHVKHDITHVKQTWFLEPNPSLIKFGILFLDAKFAKNKNSKLPKLSGCLYVWVYDLAASGYSIAAIVAIIVRAT